MQSRMRYFVPLILAALIPLSCLAEASAAQKPASTQWALSLGKKKTKKPKKQHKAPKSKRTHGAKKQRSSKGAR